MTPDQALKLGVPPWHLWGTDATVTFDTLHGLLQFTQQLSRVDYRRPETLRFFFWLAVLDSSGTAGNWTIDARFAVNFGVGRSNVSVPNFVLLSVSGTPGQQPFAWTGAALARGLTDPATGNPVAVQPLVETVVADQLNATATLSANASAGSATVQAGAFFAPNVHVRPEWYERITQALKRGPRG